MYNFMITKYGFLPEKCVKDLPNKFIFLQPILDNLSNEGTTFRSHFNDLPVYNNNIHTIRGLIDKEIIFMYSILSMIINKYIWCTGVDDAKKYSEIPTIIGRIFIESAEYLGINPSLTYTSIILANWSLKEKNKEFSLDNLEINYTMTNNESEKWFYSIMTMIEGISGKSVNAINEIHIDFMLNNKKEIINKMKIISNNIKEISLLIKRMKEKCDPNFFFNNLKIYLNGTNNSYLPNGVTIKDFNVILNFEDCSTRQSTLIQVLEIFLGVKYDNKEMKELQKMHSYMPKSHVNYLYRVKNNGSINSYIKYESQNNNDIMNEEIIKYIEEARSNLIEYRKEYIKLVNDYILVFIKNINKTTPKELIFESYKNDNYINKKYLMMAIIICGISIYYKYYK